MISRKRKRLGTEKKRLPNKTGIDQREESSGLKNISMVF